MLSKGYQIGQYVLLNQVGSGGFGDVWKAEKRTALDTNYFALKFFRPKDDRIDFEKISKELAVWKKLKGLPHIISVIELDRFEDYVYVVSDFADGGSLESWLKNNGGKASSQAEAVKIVIELLTGLENLHEKGFVHRDLKPDNILIMNGKFCLADFGVSREIKTHSKATGTAGTYEYMPPEGFEKTPSVTPQTDIWAIGVILQKLLTGELPFPEDAPGPLMKSILTSKPEKMPESISEGIREIVKKALQKNRENRFQSAREMREALRNPEHFLAEQVLKAKNSETIIDEDFDKIKHPEIPAKKDQREIEAENRRNREKEEQTRREQEDIRKKKEANKAEIERLTYGYQQHIVHSQHFFSYEIANLKRLIGPKAFDELTNKFSQERQEKDRLDAEAKMKNSSPKPANFVSKPEKTSVSHESDLADVLVIPEKQSAFKSLFILTNERYPISIPILMFGGVLLISFIISAVMKNDSIPATNSNSNMTNMANTVSCPKFVRGAFNLNLQPCKIYGRYGFSNSNGELVIDAIYEDVDYFDQVTGLARVKKDKWGFIDSNGNIKIKFLYDSAERFDLGSARVSIGQNTFHIDINGNKIQTSALNANSAAQMPIFNANSATQTPASNTNSATNQSNTISGNSPYPNVVRNAKGNLSPASGYRWINSEDPNDFRVELMPGLSRTKDGKLSPDKGYRWVNRDDPKDFRVERIP